MKKTLLGAALAGVMLTGCLGPNRLFHGLHDWNREVTDNDVVNEVVFLGLTILPVYSLAYFVDIVALNTIEYWTGDEVVD